MHLTNTPKHALLHIVLLLPLLCVHLDSSHRLKGDSYPKAATQRNPLQVQLDMTGMVLHSCVAVLAHLSEKEARGR